MKAAERRQQMLVLLSSRREDTIANLAFEFGVSERTIMRDIEELTLSAPLYTVQGNGGGIRVADGWYISRTYLTDKQEDFLRNLSVGLQPDQLKIMESILSTFAKPQVKERNN